MYIYMCVYYDGITHGSVSWLAEGLHYQDAKDGSWG